MKIISKDFLSIFIQTCNHQYSPFFTYQSLKDLNTYLRVLKEKEKKTGCTVHHVNKHLDGGKIIIKKSFLSLMKITRKL